MLIEHSRRPRDATIQLAAFGRPAIRANLEAVRVVNVNETDFQIMGIIYQPHLKRIDAHSAFYFADIINWLLLQRQWLS